MFKNEKTRKILIITLIGMLAALVTVGLIMMNNDDENNNGIKNKNETKTNNLCVEKLCISKVSIEEVNGSKAIYLELQNTGNKTLENYCVNVKTKELEIPLCIKSIESKKTALYIYEYNDNYGQKLKDYSLEKAEK